MKKITIFGLVALFLLLGSFHVAADEASDLRALDAALEEAQQLYDLNAALLDAERSMGEENPPSPSYLTYGIIFIVLLLVLGGIAKRRTGSFKPWKAVSGIGMPSFRRKGKGPLRDLLDAIEKDLKNTWSKLSKENHKIYANAKRLDNLAAALAKHEAHKDTSEATQERAQALLEHIEGELIHHHVFTRKDASFQDIATLFKGYTSFAALEKKVLRGMSAHLVDEFIKPLYEKYYENDKGDINQAALDVLKDKSGQQMYTRIFHDIMGLAEETRSLVKQVYVPEADLEKNVQALVRNFDAETAKKLVTYVAARHNLAMLHKNALKNIHSQIDKGRINVAALRTHLIALFDPLKKMSTSLQEVLDQKGDGQASIIISQLQHNFMPATVQFFKEQASIVTALKTLNLEVRDISELEIAAQEDAQEHGGNSPVVEGLIQAARAGNLIAMRQIVVENGGADAVRKLFDNESIREIFSAAIVAPNGPAISAYLANDLKLRAQ